MTAKTPEAHASTPATEAVGSLVERGVRAHNPERAKFEAWAAKQWAAKQWGAEAYRHTSATSGEWEAWQAARPRRADIGRLMNLAAKCLSADMLRALWRLEEESGRTLGRRSLSSAVAEADENLRQMAIALRGVADAL